MKKIIATLLVVLLTAIGLEAQQPNINQVLSTDFQSVQSNLFMDFSGTSYGGPFSIQCNYKIDTNAWSSLWPITIPGNQTSYSSGICTGDADSAAVFWKITHVQSNTTWFSDTLSVLMPSVANDIPGNGVLACSTLFKNSVCSGTRAIASETINVGDSVKVRQLIFQEYSNNGPQIDSIVISVNGERLGQTSFVGWSSQNGYWLHVMTIDTTVMITRGDTIVTELEVRSTAPSWLQSIEVNYFDGLPVESTDFTVWYNGCAPFAVLNYGCGSSGGPATVTIVHSDTLMLGDSMCIDVTTDMPIILHNNGQSWSVPTGTTTICLPSPECSEDNYYWWSWEDNNGYVDNTNFSVYFVRPYSLTITPVGATNANVQVTTSTSPLMLFLHENNTLGAIDSTTMLASGQWSLTGLIPSSSYYILGKFIGVGGDTISDCFAAGGFTTAPCGVATLSNMLIVNGGVDLELTLQFPTWSVGSIVFINNIAVTLVQTGTSGQWATMGPLNIPYASSVTIVSPCNETHVYNTLTTSVSDPSNISSFIRITSESISTEDATTMIELYEMGGKQLRSGNGKVEIGGLSVGIYFYRVSDSGGNLLARGKLTQLQ